MGQLVELRRRAADYAQRDGRVAARNLRDRRKHVRPALGESYEWLFHQVKRPRFLLSLRGGGDAVAGLRAPRLERAIGVIYRPRTERVSDYFHARLPAQFDAVVHLDETRAVEPLERQAGWARGELPETYPSAV